MEKRCSCVFNVCLEARKKPKWDEKTKSYIYPRSPTEREIKAAKKARQQREKLCHAWKENRKQDEARFLAEIGKLEQEVAALRAEEDALSAERRRAYAEKKRQEKEKQHSQIQRRKAAADAAARDADEKKRSYCLAEFAKKRYPCGCGKYFSGKMPGNACAK